MTKTGSLVTMAALVAIVSFGNPIPEATDVLIAGGTTAAVEAALKAKAAGKRVFVVSPRPYFGEDTAGRFELSPIEAEDEPIGAPIKLKLLENGARARCSIDFPEGEEITRVEVLTPESPFGKTKKCTEEVHFIFSEDGKKFSPVTRMAMVMNYAGNSKFTWRSDLNRKVKSIAAGCTKTKISERLPGGEMVLYRKCRPGTMRVPTPLEAKVALDGKLKKAGIGFLTGAMGVDVIRNPDGSVGGAVFATREGLKRIRAKETVDASLHGVLVRAAGGKMDELPPKMLLSRVVVSIDRPEADGMKVEDLGCVANAMLHRKTAEAGIARMYRCSFEWQTDDTPLGWAAADMMARRMTWTKGLLDAADELGFPSRKCTLGVKGMRYLGMGDDVPSVSVAGTEPENRVLGKCDVCVAGAGTAGAPAAIAAARAGAKTIAVEYLYGMGGIGTIGMIGSYWYGTRCGFSTEADDGIRALGAKVGAAGKREWWRRAADLAGAKVLFGSMAYGVVKRGNAVVGVKVATPCGAGVIGTKVAVDATGAADLAASAGEPTEFITANELALQSAGMSPRPLGTSYANTDFGYVNDNDAADITLWGLRARAGAKGEWDVAQIVGSRERRRIRGRFRVEPEDVINERTFPDTITVGSTDFDTHGATVADVCFLSPATDRHVFKLNIPYRALLPAETEGLLVAGIGASAHRDAQPFMRMQADVQNEGYAAGRAAAMAAKKGIPPRKLDVRELQKHLVEVGIVPAEVMTWHDNFPLSDAEWVEAVATAGDGFAGAPKVLTDRERAKKDLHAAFLAEKDQKRKICYAQILGMLGDAVGAEVLAANLSATNFTQVVPENAKRFGKRMGNRDAQIVALGRTKAECAIPVLLKEIESIDRMPSTDRIRAISLACKALADERLALPLAQKLQLPAIAGRWCENADKLPPLAGFTRHAGGYERSTVMKELHLASALLACGDFDGIARRVLKAYAKDPRKVYAEYARKVLEQAGKPQSKEGGKIPAKVWQSEVILPGVRGYEGTERDAKLRRNGAKTLGGKDFFPFVDRFGQYAHAEWPGKVHADADLQAAAQREEKWLRMHAGSPIRGGDEYGGWKDGPQLKATGFFRTEKVNGKWWLVDPAGHLFYSHGVNAIYWPEYSNVKGREKFFAWLPAADEFAKSWSGDRVSFRLVNMIKKYGKDWWANYPKLTQRRMRAWGLNTIGNWSAESVFRNGRVPYTDMFVAKARVIEGSTGYWGKFVDPFSPDFEENVRKAAEKTAARSGNDPWCIGWFVDNERSWGNRNTELGRAVLASPDNQPAKVEFLKRLNAKGIAADRVTDTELAEFTRAVAERYFSVIRNEIRRVAPNRLYLGCRFAWGNDDVKRIAAKYCDVYSANVYDELPRVKLPEGAEDRPIIIGEFMFGALDRGLLHAGLRPKPSQREKAAAFTRYVRAARADKRIVGAHWFLWADQPLTGRFDGECYQCGLIDVCDNPYPEMVVAMRETAATLYR